jgi:hypothetical protein
MVNIFPVDKVRHTGKGWRRPMGYGFVAAEALAPISGSEFANAATAMPIGFVEKAGRYWPVGLMGLTKGSNVFVGPTGQWLGNYVPAVLRSYPFSLRRTSETEPPILCIDEDSDLIVDDAGENAEKFFEADGTPSSSSKALTEFLGRLAHDQTVTALAVAALQEAVVIKPWSLTVPLGDQQVSVGGFHCVDEKALNALDDATFLKLRKASALVIAYGQLLSMGQVSVLARLSLVQQQTAQAGQG